ncbi:hypothetical protein [Anaerotignum sp.]
MAFLDETGLAELWSLIREKDVRIATGTYIGTGTATSAKPTTLTFDFKPKFLMVRNHRYGEAQNYHFEWMEGMVTVYTRYNNGNYEAPVTVSGNSISWYSDDDSMGYAQMNGSGYEYMYIAIG